MDRIPGLNTLAAPWSISLLFSKSRIIVPGERDDFLMMAITNMYMYTVSIVSESWQSKSRGIEIRGIHKSTFICISKNYALKNDAWKSYISV